MPPRTADTNGSSSLPRTAGASTTYSVIPSDSVQDVAESLGLPQLHHSVASVLAADVEYRIRQLVQDSSKFMRHANRTQLRVSDIDRALRLRNIEPIFGFHPTTLGKASMSGAYSTPVGSSFRRIRTQTGPIHLVADEEIDLEKVLDVGPKFALSPGVGWSAHWLAIEGVQPAVPQNPPHVAATNAAANSQATNVVNASSSMVQPGGASAFLATTSGGLGAKHGQAVAKPLIKHVLSRELQLYFERLTTSIIDAPPEADRAADSKAADNSKTSAVNADVDGDVSMTASPKPKDAPQIKTTSSSDLFESSGNTVRDGALASLRGDFGLHQLVPYLIQWVNERIQGGLRDDKLLDLMLHTVDALISNIHMGVEPYLHQLLPSILSILLTASLGHSSSSHKSYILRVQAAHILSRMVRQYTATYPTLLPRIVRTIVGALDAGCAKAARRANETDTANDEDEDRTMDVGQAGASSQHGPRDSAATKLGALIGLRHLGSGTLRATLVSDGDFGTVAGNTASSEEDCILRRLGFWCAEAEQVPGRREEVRAIADEVKVAFADVAASVRGNMTFAAANVEEALRDPSVESRIGRYWVEQLSEDTQASRGLLTLLNELQQ